MRQAELFKPFEGNPILRAKDWPYLVNSTFNPGAVVIDENVVLLVRVEDRTGESHFNRVVLSKDGRKVIEIDKEPTIVSDIKVQENLGIEDPRIVFLKEEGRHVIAYTSYYEKEGVRAYRISLMSSDNHLVEFEKLGSILLPGDKDASLFPRKIDGMYPLIHRPEILGRSDMWISFSSDLKHWGEHRVLMQTRGGRWDQDRIGLNTPPIETEFGWLILYHGVVRNVSASLYRIGLAILDLNEPWRVIHRTPDWVLGSAESFSLAGDVPGAIFPCGAVYSKEENNLQLFCGVGDKSISLYESNMDELLAYVCSCPVI